MRFIKLTKITESGGNMQEHEVVVGLDYVEQMMSSINGTTWVRMAGGEAFRAKEPFSEIGKMLLDL